MQYYRQLDTGEGTVEAVYLGDDNPDEREADSIVIATDEDGTQVRFPRDMEEEEVITRAWGAGLFIGRVKADSAAEQALNADELVFRDFTEEPQQLKVLMCSACHRPWSEHRRFAFDLVAVLNEDGDTEEDDYGQILTRKVPREVNSSDCVKVLREASRGPQGLQGPPGPQGAAGVGVDDLERAGR